MTKEEMQQKKRELGLTYQDISDRSGLSVPTVQRIISGSEINSREYSYKMIEEVLQVCESEPVLKYGYQTKKQGEYTYEDYLELPDDQRCELIDGIIYDIASPTFVHQDIAGEVYYQLKSYIYAKKAKCRTYISPIDVKLDSRTVVQPDVIILCDKSKRDEYRLYSAPDFVLEVLSPSSKRRDCILKPAKYMQSGVREYWIADPQKETVTVHLFGREWNAEDDFATVTYTFDEKVPVSIWKGECSIDFSVLDESESYQKN